MPKSAKQKQKLLYLEKFFREETDSSHGLEISEIIKKLEAEGISSERKSLYRDFEELRDFGLDVQKEKEGNRTYYFADDGTFELVELKLLVDAVQGSRFITRKKSEALIKKIESLASCHQASQLHRQVYVSNRIKTMNESIYYTVDDIHRAINSGRKISFQYFKWNAAKEKILRRDGKIYNVSPWALTWDDENYYLVAFDSEEGIIKHFRVDKMLRLKVTDEKREGAEHFKNFDMAVYSRKTFGMFGGDEYSVTLLCEPDMADPIIDRFGSEVIMIPADDGKFRAVVKVKLSPVFLTWIMNFRGRIVIETPDKVKEEYRKLALAALDSTK